MAIGQLTVRHQEWWLARGHFTLWNLWKQDLVIGRLPAHFMEGDWPQANSPYGSKNVDWPSSKAPYGSKSGDWPQVNWLMEAGVVIGHRPTHLWKQEWWLTTGQLTYGSRSGDWPPANSLMEAGVVIGHRQTHLWKHMAIGQLTCWKQELTDSELETSLITGKWLSCRTMWAMITIETQANKQVRVPTKTVLYHHTPGQKRSTICDVTKLHFPNLTHKKMSKILL